jgi:DNA topoisomerase-1
VLNGALWNGVGVENPAMEKNTHTKLFIVESPIKVRTIEKFLGGDFIIRASVGHIADIPERKGSVDVSNAFAATYELTPKGAEIISQLKKDMKQCSEIIVATDADREGELIAAHLVEFLKPQIPVKRIDFHAVTKDAIEAAMLTPREIDYNLVEAARTRRILDRLFGFEVSDVTRKKVRGNTTAGRVQSPALRLVVERELERLAHVSALYMDVLVNSETAPSFKAALTEVSGKKIASGTDFDSSGVLINDVVVVDAATAEHIAAVLNQPAAALVVQDITEKAATRQPQPPFVLSSLYQEAGNRLGMSVAEARTIGQQLFDSGLITYPRTDNPVHDVASRHEIRNAITAEFGADMVAPFHRYATHKGKHTQGAHEAIRPTKMAVQSPNGLSPRQAAMYRMIWQRTMASQMVEAKGLTVTVRLAGGISSGEWIFSASGTTYTQQGFRAVYAPSNEEDDAGSPFPVLAIGDAVPVRDAEAKEHHTLAPARFTEASLVKELERLDIGRPSTYASIIAKLRDRYVWSKKGERALIPTITAFAVHRLLMGSFASLLDYEFTRGMEDQLDLVSQDATLRAATLSDFFFGDGEENPGLQTLVSDAIDNVEGRDMYALTLGTHPETGDVITVRAGKMFGKSSSPYVECGSITKALPDETAFDDFTTEKLLALLSAGGPQLLGEYLGVPVYLRVGANGAYFQHGEKGSLPVGATKLRTAGLLKSMSPNTVSLQDAIQMLELPRVVGVDSTTGEIIHGLFGKFGAYLQRGTDTRSLKDEEQLFTITAKEATEILNTPKKPRRSPGKKSTTTKRKK